MDVKSGGNQDQLGPIGQRDGCQDVGEDVRVFRVAATGGEGAVDGEPFALSLPDVIGCACSRIERVLVG